MYGSAHRNSLARFQSAISTRLQAASGCPVADMRLSGANRPRNCTTRAPCVTEGCPATRNVRDRLGSFHPALMGIDASLRVRGSQPTFTSQHGQQSREAHGSMLASRSPCFEFPPLRRWIVLAVKLLIVAVVLWLVWGTMKQSWNYLHEHPRSLQSQLAGPLRRTLSPGPAARRTLLALGPEGLGQDVGLLETLRAYYIGHLGKYVPGKAMVDRAADRFDPQPAGRYGHGRGQRLPGNADDDGRGRPASPCRSWPSGSRTIRPSSLPPWRRRSSPGCRRCPRSSRGWRGCWAWAARRRPWPRSWPASIIAR